ncbi:MAG TPA: sugar phosphate isomerase/epimerase family protein [Bryobacteraceae bacterium]|nr:sugar phosphate isomerase/epimerase family protein [Bryobacteraceae bacterium]
MTRRSLISSGAGFAVAAALDRKIFAAPPKSALGIATTSYMTYARFREPIAFMDYCKALGAAGIQIQLPADPTELRKIRAHAEELGMFLEAMAPMPKSNDTAAFEAALKNAKEAGAVAVRTGTSGGRRYEKWNSLTDWKAFFEESTAAARKIAPIADRMKMPVGMENHKDWTVEEELAVMKKSGSEYFGTLLDFGNNIALLDSPDSILELAPYAKMCHVKDMAVEEYPKGFLLSEVPLGEGILDLRKIVDAVRAANPRAKFSLEMITRDPLEVPCLTEKYWITFPDRGGIYLARTLAMVRKNASRLQPLPTYGKLSKEAQLRVEDDNVKTSLNYAREKLNL